MKTKFYSEIILIFLALINAGCANKENAIAPSFLDIEEFVVDKTIKAELVHNHSNYTLENKIILTLPANYALKYITPTIKAHKYTSEISPGSGQKVTFEDSSPIPYTLTGKNGVKTKYNLYVRRSGIFKAIVESADIQMDKVNVQQLRVKIPTIGTVDNTKVYEALFFDENDNQKYVVTSNDAGYNVSFRLPQYFKSGKYKIKILHKDRDRLDVTLREAEPILINFIKSKTSSIFVPEPLVLKGQTYTIRGYGFANEKQYKLRLKNDFINAPIDIFGQYIDETQINFLVPDNVEEVDYEASFLENEIRKEASLLNNTMFITKDKANKSLLTLFEFESNGVINVDKPTYIRGGSIKTPVFDREIGGSYQLVLTNLNTGEIYDLIGKGSYNVATFVSYLSFDIPAGIPAGLYSVQGLRDGRKTTRYWKKIEIK